MKVMKMTWHDLCWILAVPAVVACNTRTSSEGEEDSSTPMDVLSDAEAPSETTDSDTGSEPLCEGTPSRVVAVSGGVAQCALFDSGHVKCWGRNTEGQLGLGHTENVGDDEHPSESGFVPLAGCATQISHMGFYGCAVLEGGTVQCWGSNEVGQLGLGHTNNIGDDEALSEPLRFDLPVLAVQTGMGTTYALLLDGSIVAWGWNLSNNSSCAGRLGFSSAPDILGDDEPPGPLVEQKTKATRVFPGVIMSCLTDRERRLTCWSGPPAYLGHQDPEAPFDALVLPQKFGHLVLCGLTRGTLRVVGPLILDRRAIADGRVSTLPVIEDLNPFCNRCHRVFVGEKDLAVDVLAFQGGKE
jgi:hypothetical protein